MSFLEEDLDVQVWSVVTFVLLLGIDIGFFALRLFFALAILDFFGVGVR